MPDFSVDVLILLSAVATVAGFIDAVAGGGGLLTIPALLMAGMSPVQALATNKLQACFGSFTATRFFVREGLLSPRAERWTVLATGLGAGGGALAVQWLAPDLLIRFMPYALMVIAVYLLLRKKAVYGLQTARLSRPLFNASAAPGIGFYDGFFGPGTGTFFTLSYTQLRGLDLVQATAHAKLLNFTTNIMSLLVFILSGQIIWLVGLCMAAGQTLGARLGAAAALKQGVDFIRLMTVVVCLLMSISLLLRN